MSAGIPNRKPGGAMPRDRIFPNPVNYLVFVSALRLRTDLDKSITIC
jgi:hypothetical protein